MCDNVEYKNESINKTLRLFDVQPDGTNTLLLTNSPKRPSASSCKRNEKKQINDDQMQLDVIDENIFCVDIKDIEKIDSTNNKLITNNREESNAFQVLMTSIKPRKRLTHKHFMSEDETSSTRDRQGLKLSFKQNKDKLIMSANRKGYTKRKLSEKEDSAEPEKIENKLLKRSKILKKTDPKDQIEASPSVSNQKIFVHGLHNYFNIITPEEREKARLPAVSTMIVKSDIHGAKSTASVKSLIPKIDNEVESKTRQILAAVNDIQFLQSETSNPTLVGAITSQAQEQQSQPEQTKSNWSFRINFHTHGQDYNIVDGEVLDEEKRQLSIRTRNKGRGMKTEVHKNGKCEKQKKLNDNINGDRINGINIEFNTNKSSLVTNNEIKNNLKKKTKVFHGSLERNDRGEVIEIVELKRSLNEKLAPLFMKRLKPDSTIIAARRSFLHSRSSENMMKNSHHKSHVSRKSIFPFPLVSHVTQLNMYTRDNISCHSKYPVKEHPNYVTSINPTHMKYINSSTDSTTNDCIAVNEVVKVNVEAVLQKIEQNCTDAREIWGKISSVTSVLNYRLSSKPRGIKRRSMDHITNQLDNRTNVHIDTWTQKYKPLCAQEVVGNEEAAMKLRNWLGTWKLSARNDDSSSGDEFHCSKDVYNDSSENNQVAILLGPHGSGKTASVYAISQELGYTVLEVNASSKRSGRKILKELEEATKSHRIKRTDSKFITQTMLSSKKNIPESSLILIEDVDLIFDEDEGFISAIYQLSSNTKRPIVMTCRYLCPHLSRMTPQQLLISFKKISGTRAMGLLELIALAESGLPISRICIEKLIAGGDLRRALVELQYLLLSGALHTTDLSRSFHETLWQDMSSYLYIPSVEKSKKKSKNKYVQITSGPLTSNDVSFFSLVNDLDIVSLVSLLVDVDDEALNISQVKLEPSVSLEENMDTYSNDNVQNGEISKWLRYQVIHKHIEKYVEMNTNASNPLMAKKKLNMSVYSTLSQVSSYTLGTRTLSTDYLPIVRTICRAENVKQNNNMKRGNRFFHYLQNLQIPSASIRPNILMTACRTLKERLEELPKPSKNTIYN